MAEKEQEGLWISYQKPLFWAPGLQVPQQCKAGKSHL